MKKIHLQYTGTGYVDVGVCQPWNLGSRKVTTNPDKVDCKNCRKYIDSARKEH